MMKYSVILPVYNAAQTLHRCLDSLVPQLREDTELLLVDDGSTDASAEICADYASDCSQIRIFSKQNGGVSSARNLGLEQAQGDYILFVDSDDAVAENYFTVLDSALTDCPELLMFGLQIIGRKQMRCSSIRCRDSFYVEDACACALADSLRRQEFNLITTKAFRRDFIEANHLRFDERLDIGEDKVFSFSYAVHINNVRRIPDSLYLLSMEGRDSLSRKKRDNLLESVLLEHQLLVEILYRSKLSDKNRKVYNKAIQYSYYRSAYTVCRKAQRNSPTSTSQKQTTARILGAYANQPEFQPVGFRCKIIAAPIRMGWKNTVNFVVSFFSKEEFK